MDFSLSPSLQTLYFSHPRSLLGIVEGGKTPSLVGLCNAFLKQVEMALTHIDFNDFLCLFKKVRQIIGALRNFLKTYFLYQVEGKC